MKKIVAILGILLFIVGALIVPAVHHMDSDHCKSSEENQSHNPESCAICAVAATAVIAPCAYIDILPPEEKADRIHPPDSFILVSFIPDSHPARAPPIA